MLSLPLNTNLKSQTNDERAFELIDDYFPVLFITGIYSNRLYSYDLGLLIENAFESSLYGKIHRVDMIPVNEISYPNYYNAIIHFYQWNAEETKQIRYNLYNLNSVELYYEETRYWTVHDYNHRDILNLKMNGDEELEHQEQPEPETYYEYNIFNQREEFTLENVSGQSFENNPPEGNYTEDVATIEYDFDNNDDTLSEISFNTEFLDDISMIGNIENEEHEIYDVFFEDEDDAVSVDTVVYSFVPINQIKINY